jgi:nicotinate-nucleotide adenylyltransferase
MDDPGLPPFVAGMRIGLLGGSFNPPHAAHLNNSLIALRRLGLDRVWWLVTPGNPLKDTRQLPPIASRIAQCRALIRDPRIIPTGIEAKFGTRYTADTLRRLQARCPGVRFVWLMGADNLAGFHHWRDWDAIARTVPIAVIDRPGFTLRATSGRFATRFANSRLDETDSPLLARAPLPAWVLLHGRRLPHSSTAIRAGALK